MSPTLVAAALGGLAALPAHGAEPQVEVSLVSDAAPVASGTTFEVAALFEIEDGWHIYWRDPGDTGMATAARLTAPEGFRVTGPFYPVPEVVELPGELTSYAYEDQVALFFRVTAPAALAPETQLEFAVAADWLVCREACFMGSGEARLRFAAEAGGAPSKSAARALERSRARLPKPLESLAGVAWRWGEAQPDAATGKSRIALELELPAGTTTLIPDSTGGLTLIEDSGATRPRRLVFECRGEPAGQVARGVLARPDPAGTVYYQLRAPYPAARGSLTHE